MKQQKAVKKAASLGIKLTVTQKSSGRILFPEKLAKANEMVSKIKLPLAN